MNRWTPPHDTNTTQPSSDQESSGEPSAGHTMTSQKPSGGHTMTSQKLSGGQELGEPSTGQTMTSLCYRGIHSSCDEALSYQRAHEFQRLLRLKVAHVFKVQLR